MQEISVSEFRQQCLALMDNLPKDGLLITRYGHPMPNCCLCDPDPAKLSPM